jgi:hypothetical protein
VVPLIEYGEKESLMEQIYRCTEAFAYFTGGTPRSLRPGDLVTADDPARNGGRAIYFEVVEVTAAREAARMGPVEQATAEPGERRTRTRGKAVADAGDHV